MKIQYLVYDARLDKPHSIHNTKKEAREEWKKQYGSSNFFIFQIIIGEQVC